MKLYVVLFLHASVQARSRRPLIPFLPSLRTIQPLQLFLPPDKF